VVEQARSQTESLIKKNKPLEADEIAARLKIIKSTISGLEIGIAKVSGSEEFYDAWDPSAVLALETATSRAKEISQRLAAGLVKPILWGKPKWPLTKEEGKLIQEELSNCVEMLVLVKNVLFQ